MKNMYKYILSIVTLLTLSVGSVWGATYTVTYTVTSTTAVSTSGTAPTGSVATYSQTYTTKCQMLKDKSVTYTLTGFAGCKITGVTMSMRSNSSSGAGTFSLVAGTTTLAAISTSATFKSSSWNGAWSTSYVDVTPTMSNSTYTIQNGESVVLTISATANSLYCQSITLTYESATTKADPTFSIANMTMDENDEIAPTITTDNTDAYTITYSSSDEYVAYESSGKINGYGEGTCTITATMAATDNFNAATTTFTVTVNAATQPANYTFHMGNVSACVTSPANNSTSTEAALPDATPIPGYQFAGWTTQSSYTSSTTAPSPLYAVGATPGGTLDLYPVYYQVSTTFTLVELASGASLTEEGNYMISSAYVKGSKARVLLNEDVNSDYRWPTKEYEITTDKIIQCDDWSCIWKFIKDGDYWTIYNEESGRYLAAKSASTLPTGNDRQAAYETSVSDLSRWTAISSDPNFKILNKARKAASLTDVNSMIYTSGNYQQIYSTSASVPYLFKQENLTPTYTLIPTCPTENWTVSFNMQGYGSAIASQDIENGQTATEPTAPTSDCATFGGWYTEAACTNAFNFSTAITANKTLYAKWTKKSFTLAWELDGGTITTAGTAAGSVEGGATLTAPTVTKTGYTFKAWSPTVPSTMPCATATYTATWEENTTYVYFTECGNDGYTVTVNQQTGGSVVAASSGSQTFESNKLTGMTGGETVTITATLVAGYTFTGWTVTGATPASTTATSTTFTMPTANVTVTPIFTANTHNVTYELGGGTGCTNETNVSYGTTVTVCAEPTRSGYSFDGWTVTTGGVTIADGKFTMPDADVTLTAKWAEKVTCAIAWNVNGSTYTTGTPTTEAESGTAWSALTLPTAPADNTLSDCERTVFVGWTATGEITGDGQSAPADLFKTTTDAAATTHTITTNTTFYAVFAKLASLGTSVLSEGFDDSSTTDDGTEISNSTFPNFTGTTSKAYKSQFGGIKFGSSKAVGYITSKSLNLSQAFTVTFKVKGYSTGGGTMTITAGGYTKNYTYTAGPSDNYETATLEFDAGTSSSTVKISTKANDYRAYIDDVAIYTGSATYSDYVTKCAGIESHKVTLTVTGSADGSAKLAGSAVATSATSQEVTISSVRSTTVSNVKDVTGYSYTVSITSGTATLTDNGDGTWTVANPSTDVTVTVTYTALPTYNITFDVGNGSGTFDALSTYNGGTVTIPSTYTPTHACGTFVGWAESAVTDGTKPATLYKAGDDYTLAVAEDKTLYAVYATSDGCTSPFTLGTSGSSKYDGTLSGVYYLTDGDDTPYYATNWTTSNYPYAKTQAAIEVDAGIAYTKFTLQYVSSESEPENSLYKFTIYVEASKYNSPSTTYSGYWTGTGNSIGLSSTPYYWTIAKSDDNFTIKGDDSYITSNSSNFTLRSTSGVVNFEPAEAQSYYTSPTCGTSVITAKFNWSIYSWPTDAPTHNADTYTNLAKCSELDKFPTPTVPEGWTFIGWMTSDYNTNHPEVAEDDENSSEEFPDRSEIYGGNSGNNVYQMGTQNVNFYPIFTKYDRNTIIDPTTAGESFEAYIYFYANKEQYHDIYHDVDPWDTRVYAKDFTAGKANAEIDKKFSYTTFCSQAQKFVFEKNGTGWDIRIKYDDENYLNKSYLINTSSTDFDNQADQPTGVWSLTKNSGGDYSIYFTGHASNPSSVGVDGTTACASVSTPPSCVYYQIKVREQTGSWDFQCYHVDEAASVYYYKVYLGSCEDRRFSSNPTKTPQINLTGEALVTSVAGQTVRAAKTLTFSAQNLATDETGYVTLASNDAAVTLSTAKDGTGKAQTITLTADANGKIASTPIYIHYTPTATADNIESITNVVVTATYAVPDPDLTATANVYCRVLNQNGTGLEGNGYVIVAHVGDQWLALPSKVDGAGPQEGIAVMVNDEDDPTSATTTEIRTRFNLYNVYTSTGENDRYEAVGEKVYLAGIDNKGLKAETSGTNLSFDAAVNNPDNRMDAYTQYEWLLTPKDNTMRDYTITNAAAANNQLKFYNTEAKFGMYSYNSNVVTDLRLLPATFLDTAECQVIEWKTNSVLIMYTGAATSVKVKIGCDLEQDKIDLDEKVTKDHCVYELATGDLTDKAGKPLMIKFLGVNKIKMISIPVIVSGEKTPSELNGGVLTSDKSITLDLVVLDGATLTAESTEYKFHELSVYPGGKLVVASGEKLGVNTLILRGGSSWGAESYEYKYPQFVYNSGATFTNSSAKIYYDYVTTKAQYYTLSLPFKAKISDIQYPQDIYGSNVTAKNTGSFQILAYDGKYRAELDDVNADVWYDVETGNGHYGAAIDSLLPGQGYTFLGMPKKVKGTRQTYGLHRIAMPVSSKKLAIELADKAVTTTASKATHDNNSGWNALGNPFMSNYEGGTLSLGETGSQELEEQLVNGNWTGYYVWNGKVRYVTVPSNDQLGYTQQTISSYTFPAFKHFFLQIGSGDAVKFSIDNRAANAPMRRGVMADNKEIMTGIILSRDAIKDATGLLLGNDFREEYETGDDLVKVSGTNDTLQVYTIVGGYNLAFCAINPELAEGAIPVGYKVPSTNTYKFSFDTIYKADDIRELNLIDYANGNKVTNLLLSDYNFSSEAGTFDSRFALSVVFKSALDPVTEITTIGGDELVVTGAQGMLSLTNVPSGASIYVYDVVGHIIAQGEAYQSQMTYTLPSGVYLVHVKSQSADKVIRAIVK